MDIGVVFGVEPRQTIDHRLRLLRRRGVVEIDERPAVHRAAAGSGKSCRIDALSNAAARLPGADKRLLMIALSGNEDTACSRPVGVEP